MSRDGVGRNDSCPCGSGKKFKKCCLPRQSSRLPSMNDTDPRSSSGRASSQAADGSGSPTFWSHPPGQPNAPPPAGGEWVEYVFVKDKGWTHESELKPGDQYRLKGGGWATIEPERIIRTTQEHPFYVQGKGWTPLAEIRPGDWIRTDNGWVQVTNIEDTGHYETVYNFQVADHHTYFVGGEDWNFAVWAHNAYHVKADPASREQGERFRARAQELWDTLPEPNRYGATIAVTEVNGVEVVSLYANVGSGRKQFSQGQIDHFLGTIRDAGGVAIHTSGNVHAEHALHQLHPTAPAIGISNPYGPCATCRQYFQQRGYFNLFWPD